MSEYYKVDLSLSSGWNTDFLRDCKRQKNVFEVIGKKDNWVTLKVEGGSRPSWNHNVKYGCFVVRCLLEEDMFKI